LPEGKAQSKIGIPPLVWIIAILAVAGGAGFWWLDKQSRKLNYEQPVLTPEAKAYTRNLALSEVEMKATESYLKQAVVEIEGNIGNKGDRELALVEINCVFRDPYGQVVLRERVAIAGKKSGPLAPGETKRFRLAFDNIPESWNKALPDLVIAQIQFSS
jgi:hypothetical protein